MRIHRVRGIVGYVRLVLYLLLVLLMVGAFMWVLDPADMHGMPDEHHQMEPDIHVFHPLRHKDAVFDPDALRQADPAKNKVLQILNQQKRLQSGSVSNNMRRYPIIPHILHQTWDSHAVPAQFAPWIRSWAERHPSWEYWLWTPSAVRCLLDMHFPDYRIYYDEYPDDISRADMMRYFVLYQFGGFYVDLDTECLKPLDPWTYSHQCLLTHEPYEHPFLVREENRSNVVNSPMAARPRHAFFHHVIQSLPEFASRYFGDFLHSTGPIFLDEVYRRYMHLDKSIQDSVTILPPKYFLPTYDPSQTGIIDNKCDIRTYRSLPRQQRDVCDKLIDRDYRNVPYPESYMDHYWIHVNTFDPSWKVKNTVSIFELVPKMKNLTAVMCNIPLAET